MKKLTKHLVVSQNNTTFALAIKKQCSGYNSNHMEVWVSG